MFSIVSTGSRSIPATTKSDEAFDAFWEEEARNPHRNRIRIGRTYQASIPPKLKQGKFTRSHNQPLVTFSIRGPGESDGRKVEDLETIYWHKQPLNKNEELNEYFSVAKLVSLFTRYKMLEKSKADRESQHNSTAPNSTEPSIANNGIAKREEVTNGCVSETNQTQTLDQQLIDIYNFVSSHHPSTKNDGCSSTSSATSGHKDEWTVKEARLFATALEVYGKNFGAIKKALPWKPAKSLMEHYYSSNEDGTSDEDDDYISPKETEFLSAKSKNFQTLTVATCLTPQMPILNGHDFSLKSGPGNGLIIPGQEVKALKAKPVMKNQVIEAVNGNSLMGSLKFFMDGQLVLKLNAKQQEMGEKCSWVESQDTPKIPKQVFKKTFRPSKADTDSVPDSGRSSIRSEDTGEESSDDDSLGSADSRSLPSPSFVPRYRNSKVKVENNYQVPHSSPFLIASPNSYSAVKDGNDLSKFKSDQKRVSENNALLLPEAKKRPKMSPRSSSDINLDLNNENKVNMRLIQERLQFPSLYSPFRASHGQIQQNNNATAVDLSCKSSPNSNSSANKISGAKGGEGEINIQLILSTHQISILGSTEELKGDNDKPIDGPNRLQSYLPFYEQYYRYCSQADVPLTTSRRAAHSVSPPNSGNEEVELPSRPKSTTSTTPSPKEKHKSDWNKKSPGK